MGVGGPHSKVAGNWEAACDEEGDGNDGWQGVHDRDDHDDGLHGVGEKDSDDDGDDVLCVQFQG